MEKNSSKKAFRAGIWYTAVNFLTKGAAFLQTPIFTRLMSKKDIGAFSNINSWQQVLIYLVTFEMSVSLGVARFDYKDELDQYTASILVYGSVITAVFYGIVLLNMEYFCALLSMPAYAIHILFIYMLVYPALLAYQSRNLFEYKYVASSIVSLSSIMLSIGCSVILVMNMENQLLGRVIGAFVPIALFCFVLYVWTILRGRGVSLKYAKYALKVSFPMIWHSIAIHLLGIGDRLVITKLLGEEKNALYSVAFTSAIIASALWNAMNSAWSPWAAERMNAGETEQMKRASRPYVLSFAGVIIVMLLITPEILLLMGGRGYMEAINVLPPVIVSCLCQFVYSLYVNAEFYLKKQFRIALATMIAAALNLGMNFMLIPRFGYVAAAYTTLFGYLFLFIFHFSSLMNLGKRDWYDNRFNLLLLGLFLLLVPASTWLYGHASIRYAIIGIVACIGVAVSVWKRKQIYGFLVSHLKT